MHPYADPISGIPVDSPLFRQRASRVTLTGDPDRDTEITAQEMCREIREAAKDPWVRQIALNAALRFRGGPSYVGRGVALTDKRMRAESCFWWCKHYLRFKHHGDMFEAWSGQLGDPSTKLQLLIAPDILVRMRKMEGDCAIYTMMVCALLESLGVQWQVCPCAVNHSMPRIFSHVFARAVMPDGTTESLDASHGKYPGWQVPKYDMLRLWVFDRSGRRISEQEGQGFTGLHDYRRSRGMGTMICDTESCYDDGTGTQTINEYPSQTFDTNVGGASNWGVPLDPRTGGYTVPPQNSAQWAPFAAAALKAGVSLAQQNALKPGMVILPNGTLLQQNPGYSVPFGSSTSLNVGSTSSILYIGLALGGLLLVGSMFKGGR